MRAAVFPYDREFAPILEAKEMITSFDVIRLVSFPGWGSRVPEKVSNVELCTDFSHSLDQCDVLWIVNSWNHCSFKEHILPMVRQAAERKIQILFTRTLSSCEREEIHAIANGFIVPLSTFVDDSKILDTIFASARQLHFAHIETPVIFVAGVSENTGKFHTQANLKHRFEELGYRVLWISSRKEAITMGGHPYPAFLEGPANESVCEDQRILMLNNYILLLEKAFQPDVIIVGVPGALMLYSRHYARDFGCTAFRTFQAVTPDVLLVGSLYTANLDIRYFEQLEEETRSRYSCDIDCHLISNFSVDFQMSEAKKELTYLTVSRGCISDRITSNLNKDVSVLPYFDDNGIFMKVFDLLTREASPLV